MIVEDVTKDNPRRCLPARYVLGIRCARRYLIDEGQPTEEP